MQTRRSPSRQPVLRPSKQPLFIAVMYMRYPPTQQPLHSSSAQSTEQPCHNNKSISAQPVDVPSNQNVMGQPSRQMLLVQS